MSKFNPAEYSGSRYLIPGINERVMICEIKMRNSTSGTPFLDFILCSERATDPDKSSTTLSLPMTEKAWDFSMEKISHIAKSVITKDQLAAAKSDDLDGMVTKLNALLSGKVINRLKLKGKEKMTRNQTIRPYLEFPSRTPFAEGDAVSETNLIWSRSNPEDYEVYKGPMPEHNTPSDEYPATKGW